MYPHLPKCVMRQFDYMQYIPRDPYVLVPPAMTGRDMDIMFDDHLNNLVPKGKWITIAPSHWSVVHNYNKWLLRVLYPYMTLDALGDPPRPAHQEILEEDEAREDHVVDGLPRCHLIVEIE